MILIIIVERNHIYIIQNLIYYFFKELSLPFYFTIVIKSLSSYSVYLVHRTIKYIIF